MPHCSGFLNHGRLTLHGRRRWRARLLRVMFGSALDLRLSGAVGASQDARRCFLERRLRDIDLYGVHLIDHSLRVCLQHGQWRLLLFHMVTIRVLLLLLLLLNWLDCIDRTHWLGECLVNDVGWLLFFEKSRLYRLFFVKTNGLRLLTFVWGLYWIEQPLSCIECLIDCFWSSRYNGYICILLILDTSNSSPLCRHVSFMSAALLRLMRVEWLILGRPPPHFISVRVGTHRHVALIHVRRYWCASGLHYAAI